VSARRRLEARRRIERLLDDARRREAPLPEEAATPVDGLTTNNGLQECQRRAKTIGDREKKTNTKNTAAAGTSRVQSRVRIAVSSSPPYLPSSLRGSTRDKEIRSEGETKPEGLLCSSAAGRPDGTEESRRGRATGPEPTMMRPSGEVDGGSAVLSPPTRGAGRPSPPAAHGWGDDGRGSSPSRPSSRGRPHPRAEEVRRGRPRPRRGLARKQRRPGRLQGERRRRFLAPVR
jgi:hypothetical protein